MLSATVPVFAGSVGNLDLVDVRDQRAQHKRAVWRPRRETDRVRPCPAVDRLARCVIAGRRDDEHVVATAAVEIIGAGKAGDLVVAIGADDDVSLGGAVEFAELQAGLRDREAAEIERAVRVRFIEERASVGRRAGLAGRQLVTHRIDDDGLAPRR
jgi:hypothetical protein